MLSHAIVMPLVRASAKRIASSWYPTAPPRAAFVCCGIRLWVRGPVKSHCLVLLHNNGVAYKSFSRRLSLPSSTSSNGKRLQKYFLSSVVGFVCLRLSVYYTPLCLERIGAFILIYFDLHVSSSRSDRAAAKAVTRGRPPHEPITNEPSTAFGHPTFTLHC